MRTITQRTTLPFLIAESGAASFTLAVITSPNPARRPRSPPRGRMQESLLAPELSATSRIVRIPIIVASLPGSGIRDWGGEVGCFFSPALAPEPRPLDLHIQLRRLRPHLGRAADDIPQPPPLHLAQWAAFDDPHHVADLGLALFVVRIELLPFGDDALV